MSKQEPSQIRSTVIKLPPELIQQIAKELQVHDISRIPSEIAVTGVAQKLAKQLDVSRQVTTPHVMIVP